MCLWLYWVHDGWFPLGAATAELSRAQQEGDGEREQVEETGAETTGSWMQTWRAEREQEESEASERS